MPFSLCNAPVTFQRCMLIKIFSDLIDDIVEVFIDDFLVFQKIFYACLSDLQIVLKKCEEKQLLLN